MTDIVKRLHAATLDKDNFPRMDTERAVPVGLAKEAIAEIEQLRAIRKLAKEAITEIEELRALRKLDADLILALSLEAQSVENPSPMSKRDVK